MRPVACLCPLPHVVALRGSKISRPEKSRARRAFFALRSRGGGNSLNSAVRISPLCLCHVNSVRHASPTLTLLIEAYNRNPQLARRWVTRQHRRYVMQRCCSICLLKFKTKYRPVNWPSGPMPFLYVRAHRLLESENPLYENHLYS